MNIIKMGKTMKKSKVIFLALCAFAFTANAEFVSLNDATQAAKAWLSPKSASASRLMMAGPSSGPIAVQQATTNGTAYYTVSFGAQGTLVLSSDTDVEPVIAFVKDPELTLAKGSPLWALINRDLPARAAKAAKNGGNVAAQARWARLIAGGELLSAAAASNAVASITDVRVEPFVKTKWNQSGAYTNQSLNAEVPCFDYYVPAPQITYFDATGGVKFAGNERVPCGCVATAMAQAMRFWQYPVESVAPFGGSCEQPMDGAQVFSRNGTLEPYYSIETVKLKAGGKAYAWESMPETPLQLWGGYWHGEPVTEEECQAIGQLTYDCGVAVNMQYNFSFAGGSGATISDVGAALKEKFGYESAAYFGGKAALTGNAATRANVILSNLDAGVPVLLGISGVTGGHAILADGYGFSGAEQTSYVHLNMGWGGQNDIWYNLPEINISANPEDFDGFDTIHGAVYNIFPTNSGEVVSGRVTGMDGNAVSGAVVRISRGGVTVGEAVTSRSGIYAFIVPAGSAYRVRAAVGEDDLVAECMTDIISENSTMVVGNRWGNDMQLAPACVRYAGDIYSSLDAAIEVARIAATNDASAVQQIDILRETILESDAAVNFRCAIAATNTDAFASQVLRPTGASLVVSTNGSLFAADIAPEYACLSLSNVVFAVAGEPVVDVRASGALDLAGTLGLEKIVTVDSASLALSAPVAVREAIAVDAARAAALNDAFATAALALPGMAESAAKFVNASDDRLFGEQEGARFVWRKNPCDPAIAHVRAEYGTVTSHYMRLDYALEFLESQTGVMPASVTMLRPTGTLTRTYSPATDFVLTSTGGCSIVAAKNSGFSVGAGVGMVLSNVTVSDFVGESFLVVNGEGASLVLDGAVLTGFQSTKPSCSPAIHVSKGSVVLQGGSVIKSCNALTEGGAVYLYGTGCSLDVNGASIVDCYAESNGGGVYASQGSRVSVSGDSTVSRNASKSAASDNIFLKKNATLTLAGKLTGKLTGSKPKTVGVRYSPASPTKAFNAVGGAFAAVADGLASDDVSSSCRYFVNDANSDLVAVVSGSSLVWAEPPEDDGQVAPEDAGVLVVYDGGAATNFYADIDTAFARLTGADAEVILVRDAVFAGDLAVPGDITLRAENSATLARASAVSILVEPGMSLAVSNVTIRSFAEEADSLFIVDGGALVLRNGAEILEGQSGASRCSAAVLVHSGGVFTMEEGAAIRRYRNGFVHLNHAESGIGGAVHLSNATGIFNGGVIEGCSADRAGAVVASNESKVYVSGALRIAGNTKLDGATADNMIVQLSSQLYLTGPLTNENALIGMTTGSFADAGRIGVVENWRALGVDVLTNSAVRFVNDATGERGVAVTNAASAEALLVWRSALSNPSNGVYSVTDTNGVVMVYGQLGDGSEVPVAEEPAPEEPAPEEPLPEEPAPEEPTPEEPTPEEPSYAELQPVAFTSIARTASGDLALTLTNGVEWCVYTLYGAPELPAVWSEVTNVVLKAADIAADGTFTLTVDASTTNRFWKVIAAPGVIGE